MAHGRLTPGMKLNCPKRNVNQNVNFHWAILPTYWEDLSFQIFPTC